jgi:AcrR family transcriptional regulator
MPSKKPRSGSGKSPRTEIAAKAVRLMEERGFAAVSIQHLADALDFSKANFYHHVDSKEELLHEIFVDTLQFSLANISEILGRQDPLPQRLRALIEFYVSIMTTRRAVMLVWFKERAHLTTAHLNEVTELEQQINATLDAFYRQGIAEGLFKPFDTDAIRLAVFGMCFMMTKLPRPVNRASIAEITHQLQELVTAGLVVS